MQTGAWFKLKEMDKYFIPSGHRTCWQTAVPYDAAVEARQMSVLEESAMDLNRGETLFPFDLIPSSSKTADCCHDGLGLDQKTRTATKIARLSP